MRHNPVSDFDAARKAGLSPVRAARWAAYRQMKFRTGDPQISLAEAVAQVEAVTR